MDISSFNTLILSSIKSPGMSISAPTLAYMPYFDIIDKSSALSSVYFGRVVETMPTGDTEEHTVVVGFQEKDGAPQFSIWCGDKFLEGKTLVKTEALERCEEAVKDMASKGTLVKDMVANYGTLAASDKCNFWSTWRRDKTLCKHTASFLNQLNATIPDFKEALMTHYENAGASTATAEAVGDIMELEELAFRVPVLYEGERGAGKTMTARAFVRDNGYRKVEVGGNEGIESSDLLGFLVPVDQHSMVWKDGPLARAFRLAKKEKTVLIIDEILRIRQRELSILLTALSPDEGMYRINTGRIVGIEDGIAYEEELECPVSNLCVVATTNVGSEYAVDEFDPALAERFVVLRKDTSEAKLKSILTDLAAKRKMPKTIPTKLITFYKKMVEAQSRGLVNRTPTVRTLVRALELAKDSDDVKRAIKTQMLLWVARDSEGRPVAEQVEDVTKLIERCFSAK